MSPSGQREETTLEQKTMSIEEANRLSIMRQVDKKILSLRKASEELGVSERQAMSKLLSAKRIVTRPVDGPANWPQSRSADPRS
jgi:hypothetical protein